MPPQQVHPEPQQEGHTPHGGPQQNNTPPTVEALQGLPEIWVKQKLDMIEMVSGFQQSNTYEVTKGGVDGVSWLFAKEESSILSRVCCPFCREFTLDVGLPRTSMQAPQSLEQRLGLSSSKHVLPMMRMHRPWCCCLSKMDVQDHQGRGIGKVEESCQNLFCGCAPFKLNLSGRDHTPAGSITGPLPCIMRCCMKCPCRGEYVFEHSDRASSPLGSVANVPMGGLLMCFTNMDNYRINFSPRAGAVDRALLLASAFLIDYSLFEHKKKGGHHG